MNTTLEDFMPTTDQFHSRNSRPNSNNNLGRTTRVANNLRSYFIPVNHDNMHNDSRGHQSDGRYRHRSTSSRDQHSCHGSCWTDSEAACRFWVQSAQFDTGTKSFRACICPSASQLITAIHKESCSPKHCHNCS